MTEKGLAARLKAQQGWHYIRWEDKDSEDYMLYQFSRNMREWWRKYGEVKK